MAEKGSCTQSLKEAGLSVMSLARAFTVSE